MSPADTIPPPTAPAVTIPPVVPATAAAPAAETSLPTIVRDSSNPYAVGFTTCLEGRRTDMELFVQARGWVNVPLGTVADDAASFRANYAPPPGASVLVTENRFSGCVSVVPYKVSGCSPVVGDAGTANPWPTHVADALRDDGVVSPTEVRCPDGGTPTSTAPVYSLWVGPFPDAASACAARNDIIARGTSLGLDDPSANTVYVKRLSTDVKDFYVAQPGYTGYSNEVC